MSIKSRLTLIASLLISLSVAFFCSCGRTSKTSFGIDTYDSSSVDTSDIELTNTPTPEPTIYDPTWRPHKYAPPPTEALSESYMYVVFYAWGHPTTLYMPVKVADYKGERNGKPSFDLSSLSSEYGWTKTSGYRTEADDLVEYTYYYYDCGDKWVYIELEFIDDDHPDGVLRKCLGRIKYAFIYPNEPDHFFYEADNVYATETNNAYMYLIMNTVGKEFYLVDETEELYAYEDELVLLSYLFSFVSRYTEYNPFCFEEFREWRSYDYSPISQDYPWDIYDTSNW